MKTFLFAICLLAAILLAVGGNCLYINNVTKTMKQKLSALPDSLTPECIEHASLILQYWESHTDYVGLSVGFSQVDRVTEQATLLLSCAQWGDVYGFHAALTLLQDAIEDVERLEILSLKSIL